MTFRIDLRLDTHVSFAGPIPMELNELCKRCLDVGSLTASQAVGQYLTPLGIQAVLYPSVEGPGRNVVVFIENTRRGQVVLFNRVQVIDQIARFGSRFRRASKK